MNVIKRDGRKVIFDRQKIINAILSAFREVDGEVTSEANQLAEQIAFQVEILNQELSVEDIQNIVQNNLMDSDRKDVAEAYIIYRNDRTRIRQKNTKLNDEITKALMASDVQNQNANMDEYSFGGRIGAASDAVNKDYALNFIMSELARKNHLMNEIYTHDLSSYAVGNHNCLSIPFDKLLANGFNTRQTDVRPANSISTAFQLIAVIFQLQSLQQYGGCSATHCDWTLVPYVRKSFWKHFRDGLIYCEEDAYDSEMMTMKSSDADRSIDDDFWKQLYPSAYNYAMDMTVKETEQAVEGMFHNLNTLQSRSGNQLPFTSINFGTCTLPEGRLIISALLNGSLKGVGKFHKTSIFPCSIFQCMKGVNQEPGDPNYDLFQLALRSTAQRLYPNYANVDWSGNAGYDINDPKTYFSTMGCVDGNEIVAYKFNSRLYIEGFKRMWCRLCDSFEIKQYTLGSLKSLYLDTTMGNLEIYDTKDGFVKVKKVIKNISENWMNVKLSHGRSLVCTSDHPFHTKRGRILAENLKIGDNVIINTKSYSENNIFFNPEKAWLLGMILCVGCYDGHVTTSIALDTEDDIQDAYISRMKKYFDSDVEIIEQRRGTKDNYKDLCSKGQCSHIIDYLSTKFEGLTKSRRHIPNEVFSWNEEAKYAFLAGMIDADGYINETSHGGSIVQLGSTNKELALQQMYLAQSLGMPVAFYQNHYSKKKPETVRIQIEFVPNQKLLSYIISEKKKSHYIPSISDKNFIEAEVNEIIPISTNQFSYDVETESDHFEVSGIYSHNCRTANGYDINGFGQLKDGRGNIAPVTIIMPTIAMEALEEWNGTVEQEYDIDIYEGMTLEDYFLERLDIKIAEARDILIERFEYICMQNPSSAKFMYENGVMEGYIPEEGIRSALKHGTLAIGNLGLAETLQILIGSDHTNKKGMELAKRIYQLFKDRCAEYKEEYKLNFGVYNTPAENLCFTAMKKFKEKYGVIPNVSENDFFTNSMHVPVWVDMTPIEKINIESQLTGYSSAGCITYVELPGTVKNNLAALEAIVKYAMNKDIPYFAINVPNDTCMDCGYCDEIADVCPECGGGHIQRLRRVTGYLTGNYETAFNDGKKQEVKMRVKHIKSFNF